MEKIEKRKVIYAIEIRGEKKTSVYCHPTEVNEKSIKAAAVLQRAIQSLNKLGYVLEHSVHKEEIEADPRQTTVPFPTN